MRISKRQLHVERTQTQLELKLHEYREEKDLTDAAALQRISLLMSKIAAAMRKDETFVPDAARGTSLDHLVANFAKDNDLTDIEVLQALTSHCQGILKYMLRYERHGSYDKPAGLE